jgi:hypothetical protein
VSLGRTCIIKRGIKVVTGTLFFMIEKFPQPLEINIVRGKLQRNGVAQNCNVSNILDVRKVSRPILFA